MTCAPSCELAACLCMPVKGLHMPATLQRLHGLKLSNFPSFLVLTCGCLLPAGTLLAPLATPR